MRAAVVGIGHGVLESFMVFRETIRLPCVCPVFVPYLKEICQEAHFRKKYYKNILDMFVCVNECKKEGIDSF